MGGVGVVIFPQVLLLVLVVLLISEVSDAVIPWPEVLLLVLLALVVRV